MNGGSGHHVEYMPTMYPDPIKSTSPRYKVIQRTIVHVVGLDIIYGEMCYWIEQGSPPVGEGKLLKNHDEGNGKPPRFISP